jgi:hypothetical protein
VAEKLAQRLENSDIDSRLLIASSLRSMQMVGRFISNFRQLEKLTKELLADVHTVLYGLSGGTGSGGLKAMVSSALKQNTSLGAAYASLLMQQDPHASSELKRSARPRHGLSITLRILTVHACACT